MPIPDYQIFMLPLLNLSGDGKVHKLSEVIVTLSGEFKISQEERELLLPCGTQFVVANRVIS